MIPRKKLDIGWADLAYGFVSCFAPGSARRSERIVESLGFPEVDPLACLSVRSGFDLLLEALALPPGSEVLMSAVNIRDMARIVEAHGLVPIPLDVDLDTLSVEPKVVETAVTDRSRVLVIAHLFGSLMPLDRIAEVAHGHGLLLVEDCAQAYMGSEYRGHPESDVVMFSFGTIKTNTALGGALLHVRAEDLRQRMHSLHRAREPASRRWYVARVAKYAVLKAAIRPSGFCALHAVGLLLGSDLEEVVSHAVRGFSGPDFYRRIRKRPPVPLLRLLARRLKRFDRDSLEQRARAAENGFAKLSDLDRPGRSAARHTHWVTPVIVSDPDGLMKHLRKHGFDSTPGASSLTVLDAPRGRADAPPTSARTWMAQVLYLPMYPGVGAEDLERLAEAVASFEPISARRSGVSGDQRPPSVGVIP